MAIDNIGAIEQSLGLEAGKLNEMISSEENHTIDLENRVFFSKDDYEARIGNIKKESGNAALEIAIKKARTDLDLDFTGKNMENFIKSFRDKVESESKIEPEKRYSDLKTEFEKLQSISEGFQTKYSDLEKNIKTQEQSRVVNETLLKSIPDNVSIPKDDILAILKAKHSFNIGEDGFEIIKDNNILKNETTRNNLSVDEYMKSFIKPYLKQVEGGAGGGDDKGNLKAGTYDAFEKEMNDAGITGQALVLEMTNRINKGTLKI
jgi:hypothetical protein